MSEKPTLRRMLEIQINQARMSAQALRSQGDVVLHRAQVDAGRLYGQADGHDYQADNLEKLIGQYPEEE